MRTNDIDCDLERQVKRASFAVRAIVRFENFDRIAQESGELIYDIC